MEDAKKTVLDGVMAMMTAGNLNITDIPEVGKMNQELIDKRGYLNTCKELITGMFEQMKDSMGEDRAYDWLYDALDSWFIDYLGIEPRRMFKKVRVTIKVDLMVPDNFDDYMIEEEAMNVGFDSSGNFSVDTLEYDIRESEVDNYSYANNIDNIDWSYKYD